MNFKVLYKKTSDGVVRQSEFRTVVFCDSCAVGHNFMMQITASNCAQSGLTLSKSVMVVLGLDQ